MNGPWLRAEVHVAADLPVSAAQVWALLGDFGDVSAWAPDVELLTVEGAGLGAVRRLRSRGGLVVETCVAYDASAWTFAYRIDASRYALQDYVATVQLEACSNGGCRILWSSTFRAEAGRVEFWRSQIAARYREGFIAALRATLAARFG